MLKMGDFSTLSKISIHMLRNYDKLGLLVPAFVDEQSGYRYYAENQLTVANRIQALKTMGLGLQSIKDIVSDYKDNENLAAYLHTQAAQKREEWARLAQQIQRLETTAAALRDKADILRYSIEVKEIPARIVACIRDNIAAYDEQGALWAAISEVLARQRIPQATPAYNMAIYHDEGFVESGVDIEIQCSALRKGNDTERVKFKEVPAMLAAVLTNEGEYAQISEMGKLIADWAKDNQYSFCGPHFDIYHNSPASETNPQKMVTEVGFPVQPI